MIKFTWADKRRIKKAARRARREREKERKFICSALDGMTRAIERLAKAFSKF